MNTGYTERRAHDRFEVKDNVLMYNGTTFAEIINISMGGLYCRYLLDTRSHLNPVRQIDLLNAEEHMFIQHIFCADLNWHDLGELPMLGNTTLRDCRLHFVKVDASQHELLQKFIYAVSYQPVETYPHTADCLTLGSG